MIIQITRKTWRIAGIILAIAAAGILYLFPQLLDPVFSKKEDASSEEVLMEAVEPVRAVDTEESEVSVSDVCAVHVSGAAAIRIRSGICRKEAGSAMRSKPPEER